MSLLGALQSGQGCWKLPNLLWVHQAYSQVLSMAVVAHGLQLIVMCFRLSIALCMAGCSCYYSDHVFLPTLFISFLVSISYVVSIVSSVYICFRLFAPSAKDPKDS